MSTLTTSRTLRHSPESVWSVLDDFGAIHRWSAAVESSPINAGTPDRGVGAERNCHFYDGNHIQERVTQVVEGRRLALEVFDTSMPLKSADAVFELVRTSDGGTELTMTFTYVVKFGLLGKAMDGLMLRRTMAGSLTRLLAALDEHLKTGDVIEQGWTPPTDEATAARACASS
ncbi:MAG: SRPBCC family protein [bacterium]|nr:SRPBCC family protein [bacterium]